MNAQKLISIGGNEWRGGPHHRIYFNDLPKLLGLRYETYGTGNIKSATLNGKGLSNSKAAKIISSTYGVKVWWDCNAEEFKFSGNSDTAEQIIERIKDLAK